MKFRNPKFNHIGTIDCEVEHPEYGWIPFTAMPDDLEEHGRDIYAAAMAEGASRIAPVDPKSSDELAAEARAKRDGLLEELDVVVSNPLRWDSMRREVETEARNYRQSLLDVPQQAGFPTDIVWPPVPSFLATARTSR